MNTTNSPTNGSWIWYRQKLTLFKMQEKIR